MDYARKLTLMEGGKSEARVSDIAQVLKLMVDFDKVLDRTNKKSGLVMLRKRSLREQKLAREKAAHVARTL